MNSLIRTNWNIFLTELIEFSLIREKKMSHSGGRLPPRIDGMISLKVSWKKKSTITIMTTTTRTVRKKMQELQIDASENKMASMKLRKRRCFFPCCCCSFFSLSSISFQHRTNFCYYYCSCCCLSLFFFPLSFQLIDVIVNFLLDFRWTI